MPEIVPVYEQADFPTIRAWFLIANHNVKLAQSCLAALIAAMFLALPGTIVVSVLPIYSDGEWTRGTVTEKRIAARFSRTPVFAAVLAHGGRNRSRYNLTYEFTDQQGRLQHGSSSVDYAAWEPLQPGDTIDVVYRRTDPRTSRAWLGFPMSLLPLIGFLLIGLTALTTAFVLFARGIRGTAREIRLLRDGELVSARILDRELVGGTTKRRPYAIRVRYEYEARKSWNDRPMKFQAEYEGRRHVKTPEVFQGQYPAVIDPEDPQESVLDVFALRGKTVG